MTDQIVIEDLEVRFRVGVSSAERERDQRLLICLEIDFPLGDAAVSDDLSETIDYDALARGLRQWGKGQEWRLIERLAEEVAQWVLAEFGAQRVRVTVKKFVLPGVGFVAVRLCRSLGE